MKKQSGFTLIELVVVIVILGILAVTAAPRFLNLQDDARTSSIQGLRGAMAGAIGIVYGGSAVAGEEALGKTQADGDNNTPPQSNGVTTHFGFPTANAAGIEAAVTGLTGTDWSVVNFAPSGTTPPTTTVAYSFNGTNADAATNGFAYNFTTQVGTGCFVLYAEAEDANTPAFTVAVTGNC
ncbi:MULTISPECIES: type II secretion system protein [Vibrio]|uniref:type II secretion system protein n=1 Tax=Vibrio TaxID=662 RepID=UPI00355190C1